MTETLLEINNLISGYEDLRVLHGISLQVKDGEAVAIVGANGAGKTTTLRTIMGIVTPISGAIRLMGTDVGGMRSPKIAQNGVAMVPEGREVFASLTVEENLVVGGWIKRKENLSDKFEEVYTLFPRLLERKSQKAGTLSGGEQQMLAVARALMSDPKLLLVDEPSMGLAPILVKDMYKALQEINNSGTAILLVEQNIHFALELCRQGYVLERGEIVLEGLSEDLLKEERVIEAYLGIEF